MGQTRRSKIEQEMEALTAVDRERLRRQGPPKRWDSRSMGKDVLLSWFLRFASRGEPAGQEEWRQLEKDVFWIYQHIPSPPLPPVGKRPQWTRGLFRRVRELWEELKSEQFISVPYEWGAAHFRREDDRLIPSYVARDPTSAFLLAFLEQLAGLDRLSRIQPCRRCGVLFRKVKGQVFCSKACREKNRAFPPSKGRTEAYRIRRAAWDSIRAELEQALESIRTLDKTTERQALERGGKKLKKAERAFQEAFLRTTGPAYEEGQAFLAKAKEQVLRLREKVKGY